MKIKKSFVFLFYLANIKIKGVRFKKNKYNYICSNFEARLFNKDNNGVSCTYFLEDFEFDLDVLDNNQNKKTIINDYLLKLYDTKQDNEAEYLCIEIEFLKNSSDRREKIIADMHSNLDFLEYKISSYHTESPKCKGNKTFLDEFKEFKHKYNFIKLFHLSFHRFLCAKSHNSNHIYLKTDLLRRKDFNTSCIFAKIKEMYSTEFKYNCSRILIYHDFQNKFDLTDKIEDNIQKMTIKYNINYNMVRYTFSPYSSNTSEHGFKIKKSNYEPFEVNLNKNVTNNDHNPDIPIEYDKFWYIRGIGSKYEYKIQLRTGQTSSGFKVSISSIKPQEEIINTVFDMAIVEKNDKYILSQTYGEGENLLYFSDIPINVKLSHDSYDIISYKEWESKFIENVYRSSIELIKKLILQKEIDFASFNDEILCGILPINR